MLPSWHCHITSWQCHVTSCHRADKVTALHFTQPTVSQNFMSPSWQCHMTSWHCHSTSWQFHPADSVTSLDVTQLTMSHHFMSPSWQCHRTSTNWQCRIPEGNTKHSPQPVAWLYSPLNCFYFDRRHVAALHRLSDAIYCILTVYVTVYEFFIRHLITFCMRHSRGEIYIGHGHLCVYVSVCVCVCLSVPHRIPTLLHRPGCNLEEW